MCAYIPGYVLLCNGSVCFNVFAHMHMVAQDFSDTVKIFEEIDMLICIYSDDCIIFWDVLIIYLVAQDISDSLAAEAMKELVYDAANKWTTKAYDGIQKLQNNIYSDVWR